MNSTASAVIQEILDKSRRFFSQIGLRPFLLSLPLQGPAAESNREGIREKILKNRSQVSADSAENENIQQNATAIDSINDVVDRLTSLDAVGFVLLITEYIGTEDESYDVTDESIATAACQHRPVAGGIVELVDEYERAIRGVWCRRSLPEATAERLLEVMILQLVAQSFICEHPMNVSKRSSNKLLSTVDAHCQTFPRETYVFLTSQSGLNLGKHWETPQHGGNHNDTPYKRCQCFKQANKPDAFQFWGISESRFVSLWTNRKATLIPSIPSAELLHKFCFTKKRKPMTDPNGNSSNEPPKTASRRRR
ncbi:hypothetical protein IE077_003288 [Cardiosporidium cionae]|uniref:Uncharacterized protein n=1 Tax=Cardiosporidium cionae TaxID=476202 RepID=A0ABQ7J8N2_9APIC|nr:hypothetical protein IE077_003288 [Cardiosporidium cionae]|eukprot:KAF8820323.1 hypothetical protein IE077_003288 [Cardiosporidium cionae]